MELLLGFPLSLAFASIPFYLYREKYSRKYWFVGMLVTTSLFLFLPAAWRLQAFLPGGAAVFFFAASIWVLFIVPQNSLLKLLSMPLPTRAMLKAEIEKIDDVENRLKKYFVLTQQLKSIWQKRSAMLSGVNSLLLLFFSISSAILTFIAVFYDYYGAGVLKEAVAEVQKQINARLAELGGEPIDLQKQILDVSAALLFVSSFFSVYCLGFFLRMLARFRFKQTISHGQLNLFRIPDSWVWILVVASGIYMLSFKVALPPPLVFIAKNALWISLFLYMLQGMGIVSLFFEVRLLPLNWLIFGLLLLATFIPGIFLVFAAIFALIGLMEVWLALRKRSLRVIDNSQNS